MDKGHKGQLTEDKIQMYNNRKDTGSCKSQSGKDKFQ